MKKSMVKLPVSSLVSKYELIKKPGSGKMGKNISKISIFL